MPLGALCQTLDRCVRPVLESRASRWAPTSGRLREVGQLQRRMLGTMMRVPRRTGECGRDFGRRRAQAVSAQLRRQGPQRCWSARAAQRCQQCSWKHEEQIKEDIRYYHPSFSVELRNPRCKHHTTDILYAKLERQRSKK